MRDPTTLVDSNSGDVSGPTFSLDSQSAFHQAHDFVLSHPKFNSTVNIYQNWKTGEVEAIRKWFNAPDPSTNCKEYTIVLSKYTDLQNVRQVLVTYSPK
ncbi:hypothetical protein GYMLUDRAFT_43090 [Collybiopsis luxurians FD-317 M1]|uniref:Uncharacterized protein n=1 Tax=Collybiopsis luxurians FD-317 M1 TaxID=944289 RepID=A0A0D0BYT7_9AGAR|nr:hypothetical protein GYMLUDRAFT_43090 [Collybiopsis luxurians FD-317 M1]